MPSRNSLEAVVSYLDMTDDRIVDLQQDLTATRALGPENGGTGEWAKADYISEQLTRLGVTTQLHVDAPDLRVLQGSRPNLIARIHGTSTRTLWLFGHMDVVGTGDPGAWQSDPWNVTRDGDWLLGRGVEDNQQAIVSMLLLAEALLKTETQPRLSLGLVFMSDEENGSRYGLGHILAARPEIFSHDDMFIVPDFGSPDANIIEIAEKAQLWLKFTVVGTQCHASMPHLGRNAFLASASLVSELHAGLAKQFPQINPLFSPQTSTFVPTRHENNVDAINILPGKDVFYLDCRVLPEIETQTVIDCARAIATRVAAAHKVQVTVEVVQLQPASTVSPTCQDIGLLQKAIGIVYGCDAKPVGVGGGTVAALLRAKGLPGIVWSCLENTCHQPNERSSISATRKDACVFAHLLMNSHA